MEAAEGSLIIRQELIPLALSRKEVLKLSGFGLLFLFLMALWLGFGERGFIHLYKMEKERQVYVQKIQNLELENRELLEEINRLRSDKEYIESQGRRELGLVRDGEVLYRFKGEKKLKDTGKP
jgi:cell division protein FtsB